jgi:methionyl-tRNA formyltransferase
MCKIDWKIPAEKVRNFILGMSPFPAAYCDWQGKRMKILRADFNPNGVGNPGKYFIEKGKLSIHCDSGVIYPTEILIPGKKPMKIKDHLIGYRGNVEGIIE